jgi:prepilin-type N-terminal cleavage/methylation domain-containing protein
MSRVTHTALPLSHDKRQGFTLIEISIVLTVIALIIGGIIVGRDLIRLSQLPAVVLHRFLTAGRTR